ncbi:MAG: response regulator [Deltaproteobacteria bacterium]|nr:response regulator [Deltaproteobacteria bacterium]
MAKKLLLADDSVTIQKVVGISFANEDIEILTVDNGDDALASAREYRPDVILADVVMPGKNGYEVCEALKADPALAHVPVLLLTGTFEAFDEERAEQAQANGHITKPFEAQALVDRVNELLARAPQPAAAPAPSPPLPAAAETVVTPATPQPPAAESASDDDGFDFFDDVLETDSGDADLPTEAREPATTAFEIDAGESAFDFAPVVEAPTPEAVPAPDTTTLVAPPERAVGAADATMALGIEPRGDDWPTSDQLDAAFDEDSFSRPRESAPMPDPAAHAAPGEQPTVLDLEGAPAEDLELDTAGGADEDLFGTLESPDVARQAVQDPDEGQDFAVSSSDLGDPLGLGPELATPAPVEPAAAPPSPEPEPEPAFDAPTPEPVFGIPTPEPTFEAPVAEPAFEAATPRPVIEAPGNEPGFDLGAPDPAVAASDAEEDEFPPLEPTHVAFEPAPVAGAPEPEPMAFEAPPDPTPVAVAASPGPDISGVMRDRIHDSLEKIAWEAFAELPEQLIREALAKFEEIAWEVIPQMAETLIREEIRRMKGDPE